MLKIMPKMVAALELIIENEKLTKTERQAKDNPNGKFSNQLTLCNAPVFRLGACHGWLCCLFVNCGCYTVSSLYIGAPTCSIDHRWPKNLINVLLNSQD